MGPERKWGEGEREIRRERQRETDTFCSPPRRRPYSWGAQQGTQALAAMPLPAAPHEPTGMVSHLPPTESVSQPSG